MAQANKITNFTTRLTHNNQAIDLDRNNTKNAHTTSRLTNGHRTIFNPYSKRIKKNGLSKNLKQ